jgi:signal transduction histidine kinase
MSQAVANLLDNALKYGAGEVKLSAHQHDGRAALEVADSGPGIPEGEREAVFDRFVRLEPSRSTPGNGLGLSLVRAVARFHNGTVQLGETQPGNGHPGLTVRLEFAAL